MKKDNCKCNQYSEVYIEGLGMIQLREEGKRVPEHEYSMTLPCYCKICTSCPIHLVLDKTSDQNTINK